MKAAVDVAVIAQSEVYAKREHVKLMRAVDEVIAELQAQEQAAVKRYARTRALIEQAKFAAIDLQRLARMRREEALRDIDTGRTRAKDAVASAYAALDAAAGLRKRKETMADIECIEVDLRELSAAFVETDHLLAEGRYYAAIDKARAIEEKANDLRGQLEFLMSRPEQ